MNFSDKEIEEIKKPAASIDVPLAALLAVIEVESNGVKGTMINRPTPSDALTWAP